jgi:hypothetical protein
MEFPQSFPNIKRKKRILVIELGMTSLLKLYSTTKGKYLKSKYTSTKTFHLTSNNTTFCYDSTTKVLIYLKALDGGKMQA